MKYRHYLTMFIALMLLMAGCSQGQTGPQGEVGAQGPPGPAGRDGEQGPVGPAGRDGISYTLPQYVGREACAECHEDIYNRFMKSGHPWQLNPIVNGEAPNYPFTEIPNPPEGYTWDDIRYVIGGYNWKARFIDQEGFIITGDEGETTQYNFFNDEVDMGDEWVAYHAGEEQPYDCGTCHTTGYRAEGHQDDLPGLIGTWSEAGIQCEACHGPGSLHAENPYLISVAIDRDAEQCGDCHYLDVPEVVEADSGLVRHNDQYAELFQSKHAVMDCVICHDPHDGVVQLRQDKEPTTRTTCENCHFLEAKVQNEDKHLTIGIECIDCHMPRITKNAVGDPALFTGDMRTHMMAIDSTQIEQFNEDGIEALSEIGLNFACRGCHVEGGIASPMADGALEAVASTYHEP